MNFQGDVPPHGIDELLDLLVNHTENIDFNVRAELSSIPNEMTEQQEKNTRLHPYIGEDFHQSIICNRDITLINTSDKFEAMSNA